MHPHHSSNPDAPINRYTFGTLTLTYRGLGVPLLSDKAREHIANMTASEAHEANRQAWKAYRDTERQLSRYANASAPGNQSAYDRAYQHHEAANLVKRATWARICELR